MRLTRRTFLRRSSEAAGSSWLAMQWPLILAAANAACGRRDAGRGFQKLNDDLAAGLEAVAEQIIPTDGTPGAREAGVIWFIDQWLTETAGSLLPALEAGVADLDERSGAGRRFAQLPFDDQTAVLKQIERGGFFEQMRFLTLAGMFSMPSRGGNRDKSGWALIGFVDQHAWQPPFGYYDAAEPALTTDEGRG